MERVFVVNKRTAPEDDRIFVTTEFDFGGETIILQPNSRTEMSFAKAQLCLSRFQGRGVTVEYEKEKPDAR